MNIDKFGNHVHKRLRRSDISDFTGRSLIASEQGVFDLQQKRLKGIRNPDSPDDAVNKEYVDKIIRNLCSKPEMESFVFITIKNELLKFSDQLNYEFNLKKNPTIVDKNIKNDKTGHRQ